MTPPQESPRHEHDLGLQYDLHTLRSRRSALRLFAGAGAALVAAGCAADSLAEDSAATSDTCVQIPEETAGPYPGDGSNGPDILTASGIVRSDIRSSFGSSSTTATGVPLAIELTVQDADQCAARSGAAVYLWHCDIAGRYSLYSEGVTGENYLRGVQEAGDDGVVRFTSIFPAAYSGRWPHVHFEVYSSLDAATSSEPISATSQIALPEYVCAEVYASAGYEQSVQNLEQSSLQSDNVFGDDGGVHQLATMSGSVSSGLTAKLTVAV